MESSNLMVKVDADPFFQATLAGFSLSTFIITILLPKSALSIRFSPNWRALLPSSPKPVPQTSSCRLMPAENVSYSESGIRKQDRLINFRAIESLAKIFTLTTGREFSYVFNCGGETRYSQDDSVYSARSLALSLALGRECARRKTPALIEFGSGMIYKAPSSSTVSSGGCKESAPLKPWLKIAKYKLQAEEGLEKLAKEEGLRYAVLRLVHVYGPYDVGFLARGLCLARVYQSQKREMKWLWGKELRVNTVHVWDVCQAAWLAANWCGSTPYATSPLRAFNIADKGDTSQGTLAGIFASIFHIPTGFQGTLVSSFARFNLDSVVDDVNEENLQPWADLLKEKGITKPGPLSPFMEKELLKDCDLCLDAGRAVEVLGWEIAAERQKLGEDAVREVVESYERMGWWP